MTTLRSLLATPYVMHVRPVQDQDGQWIRRAEFPELPDCYALDVSPWTAMDKLDDRLSRYLLELVTSGQEVPTPRQPLPGVNVENRLDDVGLARVNEFLDEDIEQLADRSDFADRILGGDSVTELEGSSVADASGSPKV